MGDEIEVTTWPKHKNLFYKVTSCSIALDIKANGNACIGLSQKIANKCDFWVVIGSFDKTYIYKKNTEKESIVSQNVLNSREYRKVIITWQTGKVQVIMPGHTLTSKSDAGDIKYFTLNAKGQYSSQPVHWRVVLPPIRPNPTLLPLQTGNPEWNTLDQDQLLCKGAMIGCVTNGPLYIIRAKHRGSVTPGYLSLNGEMAAYISWGGQAYQVNDYEILVGYNMAWVATSEDDIPLDAFVAGKSEDRDEPLYIGRAVHEGKIIPGKVQPSHKTCYIPYEGREISKKLYEILVVPGMYGAERFAAGVMMDQQFDYQGRDDDDEDDAYNYGDSGSEEDYPL